MTLSELSILLLPLDIANRAACADAIVLTACNFALPMLELWTAVYMMMLILICLLYTSPSPRDLSTSRMPSSA